MQASELKEAIVKALNNKNIQGLIDGLITEENNTHQTINEYVFSIVKSIYPEGTIKDFVFSLDNNNGRILIEFCLIGNAIEDEKPTIELIYDIGDYSGNFQYHS